MSDGGPDERSATGPFTELLREYPVDERRRRRRELKLAMDDLAAQQQARRDARVRRRSLRLPFVKAGVALVGRLPPALAAWAGERLGAALYRFATHSRHRVLFQLRLAFPERSDAELRTIARSSFRLMGRGALSLPSLRRRGVESLLARFELEGEQHLAEALAAGKGAIVVTYHFGPFEAAGAWLAHRHGGVAVGRDVGTLDAAQVLVDIRRDLGLTTIERGDARAIVRALRGNLPVAIVADHDVRNVNGVFVPFFGHLAHTAIGPAALAVRTGAPIVPVFVDWIGRTRYRARVGEALRPRDDLSRHEVVHELTYRFTKIGEQNIRAQPDHWLWLHKRWETRPEQRPEQPVWRPAAGPDSVVPS